MKTSYLCPRYVALVCTDENSAIGHWSELMRRGTRAYTQCREEAAELYLGAATEISLLRYSCQRNIYFSDMHLTRPVDFIAELLVQNLNFDKAIYFLSRISTAIYKAENEPHPNILDCLARWYERVEEAEKLYLCDKKVSLH